MIDNIVIIKAALTFPTTINKTAILNAALFLKKTGRLALKVSMQNEILGQIDRNHLAGCRVSSLV